MEPSTGELGRDLTKTGRDHGVDDAHKILIKQSILVLAKNGSSNTRLVNVLSVVGADSFQHPVELSVTVLGDGKCLSEHLRVWEPTEKREIIAPVTIDIANLRINP